MAVMLINSGTRNLWGVPFPAPCSLCLEVEWAHAPDPVPFYSWQKWFSWHGFSTPIPPMSDRLEIFLLPPLLGAGSLETATEQ